MKKGDDFMKSSGNKKEKKSLETDSGFGLKSFTYISVPKGTYTSDGIDVNIAPADISAGAFPVAKKKDNVDE